MLDAGQVHIHHVSQPRWGVLVFEVQGADKISPRLGNQLSALLTHDVVWGHAVGVRNILEDSADRAIQYLETRLDEGLIDELLNVYVPKAFVECLKAIVTIVSIVISSPFLYYSSALGSAWPG